MTAQTILGRIFRSVWVERPPGRGAVNCRPSLATAGTPPEPDSGFRGRAPDPDAAPRTASRARRFRFRWNQLVTDGHTVAAAARIAAPETRSRRRRPVFNPPIIALRCTVPALIAAAMLLGAGAPVRAFPGLDRPSVSIAAERGSYGFGIDDVIFRLRRAGPADDAISVRVSLAQAHLYLPTDRLNAVVRFWAGKRDAELRIRARQFNGPATQSGVLSATLVAAFGYTVGHPDSARTRMVVKDPAITVRTEQASYTVDPDHGAVRVTFVARTAAGLPRPGKAFSMAVSSKAKSDETAARARVREASRKIAFKPSDFAVEGGEWEARKTVSISMADSDEGMEVRFQRAASTPDRIRPRNADGGPCTEDICTVPIFMLAGDEPTLTIAAESDTYGLEIDTVVFTVTRSGMIDSEISGSVSLTQDDTYLPADSLNWTFTIPQDQTTATHTIHRARFTDTATQSGGLTATIDAGDDYEVGTPGSATVRMVVADPAITVRPEHAAYSFEEDDAAATVAFVARTAPGLPRPNAGVDFSVSSVGRTDGAGSPGDYTAVSTVFAFEPGDFTASGSEWEARKEVALSIVDDGETEGDETFDLKLERAPGLQARVKFRQADGSVCPNDSCEVPVTLADPREVPVLTIAVQQESYGFGIDNVVFTVTRTGTAEGETSGAVTLAQDEPFLSTFLGWSFTISADETSTEVEVLRSLFNGNATQSGNLTATIEAGDGYTVGMPGSATVRMVVADPAITVRPERAAYRFAEGVGEATIAVVARTAPGVPPPVDTFPMQVFSDHTSGTATVGDDYEVLRTNVVFGPNDFTATGGVWEARKEVSLTIVDDDVTEADETVELRLRPDPTFTPERIRPRNADGSACVDDVCTVPVTIAANDGTAVERIVISPVPPEASADHGPYYRKDDFLALPDGAVHGQGATLTFTLTLDTEVTVTGTPELVLDIFDRERRARYTGGSSSRQLTFAWTVEKGDNDPDGLEFRFLDLNGGTIRDTQGNSFVPETLSAQHFAEHRVRGGLHAMRLEVSGSASEGEPFEIRVVRNGGFEEVAVAGVGVADSALPHEKPSFHYAVNGPGRRQFDFDHGAANEPGVRVSTRTVTPVGDGVADASRTLTIRLTGTDAGFQLTPPLGDYRAWYLAEGPLEVTVPVIDTGLSLGEAGLRVHGASVREAPGAKLAFKVSLSPHSEAPVTVDYRTGDDPVNEPKAVAGEDYVATSGTLTFDPGETLKTVEVEVLADDHDESLETMRLILSNAQGARIDDASGLGVIKNTGPIPKAWLGRFGRTVAEQVLGAVESRMRAARQPGTEMTLAGQRVGGRQDPARASDETARLSDWLEGDSDPAWPDRDGPTSLTSRGVTQGELLSGTSFAVTAEAGRNEHVSLWGRGAVSRFDGREGDLTLDGEVSSAMVGVDWARENWTAGLIVSRSAGEGGYVGHSKGRVEATLTGLYPWGRLALSERVDAWGAAGYGTGELSVTPKKPGTDEDGATVRTDLHLRMAAAGLRGNLLDGGRDGLTLTGKTDALIVQTASDAARGPDGGNLAAARALVTRLRLGLEGSRPVSLSGGASLTPSVEIGVRHDGGDAETGFGIDFGGGIAWSDPKSGLSAELRGRGLLTHDARGFRERGFSGSLAWDPTPSSQSGPKLTLTQTVGASASGGADALLARGTLAGLGASSGPEASDTAELLSRRLDIKFGYGFAAGGGRFASIPEIGFGLSDTGRDFSLGWRLAGDRSGGGGAFQLSAEARRYETDGGNRPPEHGIGVRLSARW